MRNRLDVYFRGIRTTVRFPSYLWELALTAKGFTDVQLAEFVKRDLMDSVSSESASEIVKQCLIFLIEDALPSFAPEHLCSLSSRNESSS